MKITELENEAALDLLADLIEPSAKIFSDPEIKKLYTNKAGYMTLIRYVLKHHQAPIVEILATLDGVPVEEYHANIPTMIKSLLEILNDKDLIDFFSSVAPKADQRSSGSAMESTEGDEN